MQSCLVKALCLERVFYFKYIKLLNLAIFPYISIFYRDILASR
ncbi:hypothetical protein HMPREF1139_1358 [Campylobacter sp. FOBRC14]|nr:hypothetical protein HMPREF1139_1358 [Campylobacter sp. FOBRC14]